MCVEPVCGGEKKKELVCERENDTADERDAIDVSPSSSTTRNKFSSPASRLFSSSSFRADTGLCTISPAAILLTRSGGRRWIGRCCCCNGIAGAAASAAAAAAASSARATAASSSSRSIAAPAPSTSMAAISLGLSRREGEERAKERENEEEKKRK